MLARSAPTIRSPERVHGSDGRTPKQRDLCPCPAQQSPESSACLRLLPRPDGYEKRFQARAATTFENTFAIWLPMVSRTTITTIDTSTRMRAYSTIPSPPSVPPAPPLFLFPTSLPIHP